MTKVDGIADRVVSNLQGKVSNWLANVFKTFLGDLAAFVDSFYALFVIVCLIGIYVNMAGAKEKGTKMSMVSFISYLIVKVMASAYGK